MLGVSEGPTSGSQLLACWQRVTLPASPSSLLSRLGLAVPPRRLVHEGLGEAQYVKVSLGAPRCCLDY